MSAYDKLAEFGAVIAREHHRIGDVDEVFIQNAALKTGVLEWVTATEPCGPECTCARIVKFPQQCLRSPEDVADQIHTLTSPASPTQANTPKGAEK